MSAGDRIVLSGMEFHARHGALPEEAVLGAVFSVDVEVGLKMQAGDKLEETVDYSLLYDLVRGLVTGTRYRLIESLAVDLADRIMADFAAAQTLLVRVHKPAAPLPAIVRDVFVEVSRSR